MATRTETLTTEKSLEQAINAGRQTMEGLGLKVTATNGSELHGQAGSKLMVYWIGLLLPTASMPVKVDYRVSSNGARTVEMTTKSSVPLSFYLWKYKARANQVADALKQGVASQLA